MGLGLAMPDALVIFGFFATASTAILKLVPRREPTRETQEPPNGKHVTVDHCTLQHKNLEGWMGRLEVDLREVKGDVKTLLNTRR